MDFTPEFRLHPPKEVAVENVASETETEVESNETVPSEAVPNAEVVAESEGTVVEENELPKEGAPPITAEGVTKNGEEVEVAGA